MSRRVFAWVMLVLLVPLCGADWKQFRGDATTGVALNDAAPIAITADHVRWTAELPGRGLSGPIIIGDRVVTTASSGYLQDRLHVLCHSAASGKKLWERQFWATGRTMCHQKMCVATPTPASDGKRIFAFYSSNDVICLDLDGNLLWYRGLTHDYPNASNSLGMASSPIVSGETLVVQVENDSESFATGLDTATGANRWKMDRPISANWTSPAILPGAKAGEDLVLLQSTKGLLAVRPYSGDTVWTYESGCSTIPSTTVHEGIVYTPAGGLTALKPEGSEAPKVLWQSNRLGASTPSPLVIGNMLFTVNKAGVLTAGDIKTGESPWQLRLEGGAFSATPIAAGGHLYLLSEKGLLQVVKPGDTAGEVVAKHNFDDTILATPAISGGALYVRGEKHLWRIAEK